MQRDLPDDPPYAPAPADPARAPRSTRQSMWPLVLALILTVASIGARWATRGIVTSDMGFHVLPWFTKLQTRGIFVGLGQDFYNYTPPYLYLLAVATVASRFMSAVTAIKLISTAFDVYCAFMIYLLVRKQYRIGFLPHLAAALFFAAPTVVANTGVWGQADSIYTAFLLTCLYLLIENRPLPAVVFWATALAFKPQAVFFLPLLALMTLWRRIPWYEYLTVPLVYAIWMLPAVLAGRTWVEVFTVYSGQAGSGKGLTHNAATAYVFVPKTEFDTMIRLGVFLAMGICLLWVLLTWVRMKRFDLRTMLLLALISVTLTPFVLPNMHDRYFYPADVISIALAFVWPHLWFIPVLFQITSGLSYSIYLLSAPSGNLVAAAVVVAAALGVLFYAQISLRRAAEAGRSGPT